MPPQDPILNITIGVSGAGGNISQQFSRTADGGILRNVAIPAAKAGQLTTRTDNDTGTLTMGAGHGITTGQIVDIYWNVGGVPGRRYGVTVGTVSGNSVPIDLGSGDNLPANNSAVTVSPQITVVIDIDGDNLALVSFKQHYDDNSVSGASHLDLLDASNAQVVSGGLDLNANEVRLFDIFGGATNVFTGNIITKLKASNRSSTAAAVLQVLGLQDSSS
jgi:hypothetical protein